MSRNAFDASDLFKFLEAQQAAEAAGTEEFTCPLCGSQAHWSRHEYNNHLHALCKGCGMIVME